MKIAFDVDDTLIIPACAVSWSQDTPNYEVINIYRFFQSQGHYMIIWSGGGKDYAEMWARRLGLNPNECMAKTTELKDEIDIAFDDCDIELAKVNVKVKRINNSISRKEWNEHS